jgi:hypothetical protein
MYRMLQFLFLLLPLLLCKTAQSYSNHLRLSVVSPSERLRPLRRRSDEQIMTPANRVTVPAIGGDSLAVLFKWTSIDHSEYADPFVARIKLT